MLRADLCDFSDAYIVVKWIITATVPDNAKSNKSAALKNNSPSINCVSKSNNVLLDNAEDLDVEMPIKCSKNTEKQQIVCGVITGMNQVIIFLLILNLLNTKKLLQEVLIILVLMITDMMQIKLVKMRLKLLFH